MAFRNQQAFDDPVSRLAATGVDLRRPATITDPQGRVLAYVGTGGVLSPVRHELRTAAKLFRLGSRTAGAIRVATGAWWLDQAAFDQLVRFAQVWDLSIGMAVRLLCLVPPEWSDATLLVRARVVQPILAWRGLGNSVVTPAKSSGASVRMPHQNDIAARRLHQLFIPGLADQPSASAISIEQEYVLDASASKRGFLYL
jgi:hypothetical protein